MPRAMLHATCAAVTLAMSASALGEPAPHELRWERAPGAESCIAAADLQSAVEQRIGHPLGGGERVAVRIVDARVEPSADGFRVRIAVRDDRGEPLGERELVEVGDCHRLDDELVLVIALIADPDAVRSPPDPVVPAPAAPPPPVAAAIAPVTASRPWRSAVTGGGIVALGILPGIGIGADVAVEVDPPAIATLVASATGWLPAEESVAAGGTRFTLFGLGVAACPRVVTGARFAVRACAGVHLGRIAATGFDFEVNRRTADWIGHARAEADVVVPMTRRLSIVGAFGVWVPVVRPRFVYSDGDQIRELYQAPAASAIARAGVRVDL